MLGDQPPAIKDCEIVYVAFDILYAGDELGDVRNRPLSERQALLREAMSGDGPGAGGLAGLLLRVPCL